VAGLRGVTLYEPGALTLVAAAGTPVAEIEALLAAEGQRLAFEPPDFRGVLGTGGEPTIGGVMAANASGPRRVQGGAARDYLLGVRFVDGLGTVIRNGGRVMKNVTGYDLVKLMAGARGTLGVLSEVALKVLPRPESAAVLALAAETPAAAVRLMSMALGSPYDVTGAAWSAPGGVLIRIEGFAASVAYRGERLRALLGAGAGLVTEPAAVARLWQDIRDLAMFHGLGCDLWRLAVKPSDAPGLIGRAGAETVLIDWGGGLIWLGLEEGSDLRARLGNFAGHAMLVRASAATRARIAGFHPEPPAVAALSRGLRARFDPRGILNPGLMG
jgi:glycolate oxidase FAD binding subunit